jgi:hypothetical protein
MCERTRLQVLGQRESVKKALKCLKRSLQQRLIQYRSILLDVSA